MASKRKVLCVNEKVTIIRAIEKGEKKSDVRKRFGLSSSTVATIWKNKEKFLLAEGKSSKKLRKPKFQDLDQAMLSWFNEQHQNIEPLSGPIVKANAEKFARELGITDFKASEGWLGKFKQRHNISFSKMNKELQNIDINVTSNEIKEEEEVEVWLDMEEEKHAPSNISNENEQKLDVDHPVEAPPSIQQALDAVKLLEKFILLHKDASTS